MGQLAFFGIYSLVSGPAQMQMKRKFTVSESSSLQSLLTFHLCHTNPVNLAVNLGFLGTFGAYHYRTMGRRSFITLFAIGSIVASIAVYADARTNSKQVQAGSFGGSMALLTHTAFRNPAYFGLMRIAPLSMVAGAAAYGIYFDDAAIVGGIIGGYSAFLLAL